MQSFADRRLLGFETRNPMSANPDMRHSRLTKNSYRFLGSCRDAEEAVQDCFLKWRDADRSQVRTPAVWLSSVCTHRCLHIQRTRQNIDRDKVRCVTPRETQESLLRAFQTAVMSGRTTQLAASCPLTFVSGRTPAARPWPPPGLLKARTGLARSAERMSGGRAATGSSRRAMAVAARF
jgi:hypothetical protein